MHRTLFVIACILTMISTSGQAFGQLFPSAIITPEEMTFDDTRVGTASATQAFTVTKDDSVLPLVIFGAQLGDAVNFDMVDDGCAGATLHQGQSCLIQVRFTPTLMSFFETSLTLLSVSREIIDFATLEGRGVDPQVVLSTRAIDFGDQTVGVSSGAHEILLVNSGTADLAVDSIATSGPFAQTDDCGSSVAAGGSCTMGATFTPTALGPAAGSITIADDAPDTPQTVTLAGNGVAPGTPDVSLSTHTVDFGSVLVGTTSDPETVIATNTGTVNLNFTSIVAGGDYAQTNDCPATLAPAASCTISITLTPSTTGEITGTLTFTDDASDSPQTVQLKGNGISPDNPFMELSAESLDFGTQQAGTTSDPQTVTLSNVGTADITGDSSEIEGDGAHSFSSVDNCSGTTITVGSDCTIDVVFTPAADGTFTATLVIINDASDSPQRVTLRGVGGGGESGGGCSLVADGTAQSATSAGVMMIMLAAIAAIRNRMR